MAVAGAVAPAVVVVVVQCEQVFHAPATWIYSVGSPKVALNLLDCGCPFAVHVPARPSNSGHSLGGFLGGKSE